MEIVPFENLKDFHFNNAKAFWNISIQISSWSRNNDDKLLPIIPKFNLIKTFLSYDTFGFTQRKFSALYKSEELNMLLVSFSSTQFTSEWLDDFDIEQTKPDFCNNKDILVHREFYYMYHNFRDDFINEIKKNIINDDTLLVLTAHSLGGAVASVVFLDIISNNIIKNRVLYTFGSPRSGNNIFAETLTNEKTTMRVVNTADIVPTLPPPILNNLIFTHFGNLIYFTNNLETYANNHSDSYNKYFNL